MALEYRPEGRQGAGSVPRKGLLRRTDVFFFIFHTVRFSMRHVTDRGCPHSPDGSVDIGELDQVPFTSLYCLEWAYSVQLHKTLLGFSEESPIASEQISG